MNQATWYCGNIVVATFLCLNITFLSATGAPISTSNGLKHTKEEGHHQESFPDVSFGKELEIGNRTVTCTGGVLGSHYPSPMYTCQRISVNGEKLYHGYSAGDNRHRDLCNSGCPCGTNAGHPTDIRSLCTEMLRAHGVTESLIAAYVVEPTCTPGVEKLARRVKMYHGEDGAVVWEDVHAPNGYINILQCLTEKGPAKS